MSALKWLLLCGLALLPTWASSNEPLPDEAVIGVLAVRPMAQELQHWAALEDYLALRLSRQHPGLRVRVLPLPYDELDRAVLHREVDFVLTQPAHYILLSRRHGLSAPLATLLREQQGEVVGGFGGVILTRADHPQIHSLADVVGQRIATINTRSLGAYAMQVYELRQAGLRLPREEELLLNGVSHDLAIEALLAGEAEVAFVRSGVIEAMRAEGRLDETALRVINRQPLPHFPFVVSTRLYPEWPFATMPHVGNRLNNALAAALLTMPLGGEAARLTGIHGFTTALNYEPVDNLLRELRLPPYDGLPHFTAEDVWYQYQLPISLGLLMALLILVLMGLLLASRYRLKRSQAELRERVKESECLRDIAQWLFNYERPLHDTLQACVARIPAGLLEPSQSGARICVTEIEVSSEGFREGGVLLQAAIPQPDGGYGKVEIVRHHPSISDPEQAFLPEERELLQGIAAQIGQVLQHLHDQALLAESEARSRAMVSAIPDMLFRHDEEGRYLDYQAADSTQLLLPPEAFIGRTIAEIMPTALAEQAMQLLRETLATGKVGQMEYQLELPGGPSYFELRMSRISDHEVLAIARDVTARKQMEQEIRRSNQELEQFAYAVSHDMRQPLRMISGHLQILERSLGDRLDAEQRESFNFARSGAVRMDGMIVSLLEYSRVGRLTDPMAELASRVALDEALRFLGPSIDESHAELVVSGEWPTVYASRDEITRLLQNLIGNAVKYRIEAQVPHVQVLSQVRERHWRVEIRDNGIGIDPGQRDRLFKVFSRLQTRTSYEGSGVGLALCRKIVEHHAGQIGVESEGIGKGSCFWFELPLYDVSEA